MLSVVRTALKAFTLAALLVNCGGGGAASRVTPPDPTPPPTPAPPPSPYIKHVVIIVQENRSFNDLFEGFPGANTSNVGKMSDGTVVQLYSRPLYYGDDIDHSHLAFQTAYDHGKMNGFDKERYSPPGVSGGYTTSAGHVAYSYVQRTDVQPYWSMAEQYALADDLFSSQSSASFTAHQELVAGTAAPVGDGRVIDFPTHLPWGCDAPAGTTTHVISPDGGITSGGPAPCFDLPTIADLLDARGIHWTYYAPPVDTEPPYTNTAGDSWSVFDGIKSIRYGPEWSTNVSSPETNIFADISAGKLASLVYVIPSMKNSDHSASGSNTGPSWVASVVNAIGQSPYWNHTAIIITWDEWGGWYDNVSPPQLRYDGLGFRVPMIVVSPYARHGYVSHTQYEFGSVLRFVEQMFSLRSLGTTDATANSIVDCFDFTQTPAAFKSIQSTYSRRQLLAMPSSDEPPDDE